MQDIILTIQKNALDQWEIAFPHVKLVHNMNALNAVKHADVCWLHAVANSNDIVAGVPSLLQRFPDAKIVVLADDPKQQEAFLALSLGAHGYCHAYSMASVLEEVRASVLHGGIWLGNAYLKDLIAATTALAGTAHNKVEALLAQLTKREKEVALAAATGLSNKEIARQLSITERTVKAHLASIFETIGARDRLQLAIMLNAKS